MLIMPSQVGYDFVFGTLNSSTSAQLASSHLGQYLADYSSGNSGAGCSRGGPIPLRSCSSAGLCPSASDSKLAVVNGGALLTQSILSGRNSSSRSSRHDLSRSDSLEDHSSNSADDDLYSDYLHSQQRPLTRNHRRNSTMRYTPILKTFFQLDSSEHCKKRVKFADDLGLDLSSTYFFDDSLDDYWEPEPLPRGPRGYSRDSSDSSQDLVVELNEWQVNFSQPAADYLGFRERLEANCVGLENVIIKQKSNSFMGTIKVKNIAFVKDVFVRCSFDGWVSSLDFPAKYCPKGESTDKFDTFSFEISVPVETERVHVIEFCVGFRADGKDYWDSNSGRNYQLITSHLKRSGAAEKSHDAYAMPKMESWGEFASWNHLDNKQPYW